MRTLILREVVERTTREIEIHDDDPPSRDDVRPGVIDLARRLVGGTTRRGPRPARTIETTCVTVAGGRR